MPLTYIGALDHHASVAEKSNSKDIGMVNPSEHHLVLEETTALHLGFVLRAERKTLSRRVRVLREYQVIEVLRMLWPRM